MDKHIDDPNACVKPPAGKEFTYCGATVDASACVDPTQYEGKDICKGCHEEYHEFVAHLSIGDD